MIDFLFASSSSPALCVCAVLLFLRVQDVVDGRATGSVRVSVPYFATFHECFSFCAFVARNFAEVSAMKG